MLAYGESPFIVVVVSEGFGTRPPLKITALCIIYCMEIEINTLLAECGTTVASSINFSFQVL